MNIDPDATRNSPGQKSAAPVAGGGILSQVISEVVGGISGARVRQSDSIVEAFSKNLTRTIANTAGREIVRGIMGSLFGGTRRGR